jgi:hypothetical protein
MRAPYFPLPLVPAMALVLLAGACDSSGSGSAGSWAGTVDTLSSGQVVVRNPSKPIWAPGDEWGVVEELRIGRMDGEGPDLFGRVASLEVDGLGRIWVIDSQSQEIRVFDVDGGHVRTVGRRGGGPGELAQAVRIDAGPDGHMWVMDPQNNRISIFDTAGTYLDARPALGGFVIMPWPGGFDRNGHYYAPVPRFDEGFGAMDLVRHDPDLVPLDTLRLPRDPVERDFFEHRMAGGGVMLAGVPFGGGLASALSRDGTIWGLVTDQYRLFELNREGDTLRTITRQFTPEPVSRQDREEAMEELSWFVDQGGRVDPSKIPGTKPPTGGFFLDDEGRLWVQRVTTAGERNRVHDLFDTDGRFLGTIRLPFPVSGSPAPVFRSGMLYAVTQDELEVQYVVRARIGR